MNGPTFSGRAGANRFSPRSKPSGSGPSGFGPARPVPLVLPKPRVEDATSTAARRFDCSDVDLFHLHHRIERALGDSGIGIGNCLGQGDRRDLPGQSPFVLAPAALTLLAAIADNRVPIAIRFGLVSGCDLKR